MGELAVLNETGDTKLLWDPNNPDEVEAALATFKRLRAKGFIAYKVQPGGDRGEIMREFDPQAEKVIMAPAVVGG